MVKKSARRTRRTHNPAFKARVVLAALREDKTMAELCKEFVLHPNQITECKRQLLERAANVLGGAPTAGPVGLAPLHAKIGQLIRAHSGCIDNQPLATNEASITLTRAARREARESILMDNNPGFNSPG